MIFLGPFITMEWKVDVSGAASISSHARVRTTASSRGSQSYPRRPHGALYAHVAL